MKVSLSQSFRLDGWLDVRKDLGRDRPMDFWMNKQMGIGKTRFTRLQSKKCLSCISNWHTFRVSKTQVTKENAQKF